MPTFIWALADGTNASTEVVRITAVSIGLIIVVCILGVGLKEIPRSNDTDGGFRQGSWSLL
jgi:hypothetical protein